MRQVSHSDACVIDHAGNLVRLYDQGKISDRELINALFDGCWNQCESDFAIEQCIAGLPEELHASIQVQLRAREKRTAPASQRGSHILQVIEGYLSNPTGKVPYEVIDDRLIKAWASMKGSKTLADTKCRISNCANGRVEFGIYCPLHHFEMIYRQAPPSAVSVIGYDEWLRQKDVPLSMSNATFDISWPAER